jgi:ribose transport system permease protein
VPKGEPRESAIRSSLSRIGLSPIWVATIVLFIVSPFLAPGSIDPSALLSILPFAAILAIAGIGQTLVVQQRGLDLSVPGMISLASLIMTRVPNGNDQAIPAALGLVLVACIAAGLLSGVAVTRFGITPLVATLGVNALLIGVILQVTNGTSTSVAPPALAAFAIGKTSAIPNSVIVAVIAVGIVALVVNSTVVGRRFVAVGASPAAARAAGIHVRRYQLSTYAVASIAAGLAGVLLAGFLRNPGLRPGDDYLLPSIAAVVLGGTSLAGGSGSVIATAVGALFLTQLQQVVLGIGGSSATELVIQGVIIALGMGLRTVHWRELGSRFGRAPGAAGARGGGG